MQFEELLEASISYLQSLKAQGVRTVLVSPETLAGLGQRVPTPAARPSAPPSPPPPRPAQVSASPVAPSAPRPRPSQPLPANPVAPLVELVPPPPPTAHATLTPEAKAQAMAELRQRASACVKCPHLVAARNTVVFGVGNINASLMFVGEAPGSDEDRQGEPFVGAAGQLLTKIIQTMGLSRETVYIANILKCRPDTPGQAYGNRKPTAEEMQTCIPYLHEQIDLIRPQVLVALGATAVEGLLGKTLGITKLRGRWHTYRDIPLMPTYHPAFLLRSAQPLADKRKVWEDMLQVMERLALPISDKQRAFFLKP